MTVLSKKSNNRQHSRIILLLCSVLNLGVPSLSSKVSIFRRTDLGCEVQTLFENSVPDVTDDSVYLVHLNRLIVFEKYFAIIYWIPRLWQGRPYPPPQKEVHLQFVLWLGQYIRKVLKYFEQTNLNLCPLKSFLRSQCGVSEVSNLLVEFQLPNGSLKFSGGYLRYHDSLKY